VRSSLVEHVTCEQVSFIEVKVKIQELYRTSTTVLHAKCSLLVVGLARLVMI
jgi:hypothetical protein